MQFRGVYTALVTPFASDESLDEATYESLVRRQVEAGVAGVVPCGTTGESPTLSMEEHEHVIDVAVAVAKGKCQVIAGAGSNSTREAVRLSRHAEKAGADAVLSVNPYYNKPTQLGLYRHFRTIAESVDIPVVLYNIPGRTGVNVETDTLVRLAQDCPNIVAVKEASGDLDQVRDVVARTSDGFAVLSGDDNLTVDIVAAGGVGVISVASNLIPEKMVRLCDAALSGDLETARAMDAELAPLFSALFVETNPIPVKTAMAALGLCAEVFRLPLCPLSSDANRQVLFDAMQRVGLL